MSGAGTDGRGRWSKGRKLELVRIRRPGETPPLSGSKAIPPTKWTLVEETTELDEWVSGDPPA